MTETWRCVRCGWTYTSPIHLKTVTCPQHPTGRQPKCVIERREHVA